MHKCEYCAIGKAKQKNVPKYSEHQSRVADCACGRMFLDMSSLKNPKNKDPNDKTTFIANPQMRLLHDEYSECRFTRWFSSKNSMVEPTCELFSIWLNKGMEVKNLRMDGSGENFLLEQRLKSEAWKLYPEIEYTARNTP